MRVCKKIIALMLCAVMTLGVFGVAGITLEDLAGFFKAEAAYTFTTRNDSNATKTITQTKVVGVNSSFILGKGNVLARDFWYNVYANDYFDGHSEPTDLVVPGLSNSEDYTPQGMTYWEAKNWILISAYDASGSNYATVIYAIDVASGQMVALFRIIDADGTVNTSHGGGIAASEHNFYFADSASNISYIPLSEMNVSAGTSKDIKIKGTINLSGEMGGANTSYCCYDDGVLWAGNFYYAGNGDYDDAANAQAKSMLLGYKLEGDSSQEEWDFLCGKYKNLINVTKTSDAFTMDDYSGGGANDYDRESGSYSVYRNGDTIDIVGNVTAPGTGAWDMFGNVTLENSTTYLMEFTSTHPSNALLITDNWSAVHALTDRGGKCEITEDGLYHYSLEFTTGVPSNGTAIEAGTYNVRFDAYKGDAKYDLFDAGETFTITDYKIKKANISSILELRHTSVNNDNFNYAITTNADSSINIKGTAYNKTASVAERTSNYADFKLVEGETYTLSFISDNQLTDAYIFAPAGSCGYNSAGNANSPHMRLCAKRGKDLGNGTYYYETTFTAGKSIGQGDSNWPAVQSTNGAFTGSYYIRFDQDDVPANGSRTFNITNLSLKKANNSIKGDRIHFPGTAGYPTYVVAIDDAYDKIQYAMVDNGKVYLSRSWDRNMSGSNYISELDIFEIDLNVPGTHAYTINGAQRTDCYYATGGKAFYNLAMAEALCVVDDYLYMFYESAAYNYRQKETNNKSTQPVDVVWKVDQYAIMGEDRRDSVGSSGAREAAHYVDTYEKVTSLEKINYTDEYIIVYESDIKAANGNKILYALDSYGGFKDGYIPKNSNGTQSNTADSLGIVGHPITKYSLEGDVLKLNDAAADDKDSLLWNIIGAGTGALRLENMDSYYGKYKNLYFGSRLIYMMNNSEETTEKLDHIEIEDNGDGTFSFYYDGAADYYLWCNDGSVPAYMDAYDAVYNNTYAFGGDNPDTTDKVESATGVKAYAGQTEQPGTFHSDAFRQKTDTDSGNKTGKSVDSKYTKFHIYRRADDLSSSGKSGLSTDLTAELQSDGTYTITLESYSTGQTITKKSTDGKPIDFVFVLDTSGSMNTNHDVPYWGDSGKPETYDIDLSRGDGGKNGQRNVRYVYEDGTETYLSMWPQTAADDVASLYSPETLDDFYLLPNGEVYNFDTSSGDRSYAGGLCQINADDKANAGGYYWTDRTGDANRLTAMKQSTLDFIEQIAEHAEQTGLQHRISIIQFGSTSLANHPEFTSDEYGEENYNNTGIYTTIKGVDMQGFASVRSGQYDPLQSCLANDIYKNAFFPATHDNLVEIVNNISVSGDPDTFIEHGFEMATNTIYNQMLNGKNYGTSAGATEDQVNASACVVTITDGVPGWSASDVNAAYRSARFAVAHADFMKAYDVDIYAVQMGNESSKFPLTNFLKAISSDYIGTKVTSAYDEKMGYGKNSDSLTLGTNVASGYYYAQNLSTKKDLGSLFDHLSQVGDNSLLEVETVTLGSDSVTLQSLGDTFMLTNTSTATAKTSQIYYDSLGRIYEEAPVNASYDITKNVSNNTVQLTGFDYSSEYVANGNAGKKLYLQIDGVLLNPAVEHGLNLPISNEAKTAIYANSSAVSSGTATQYFPQAYFEVPTYPFVYDFGISMANSTVFGNVLSLDTVPDEQDTTKYTTNININGDSALSISGGKLYSNIAPNCNGTREAYMLIQKPAGDYYWAKASMLPASNVLFEESFITAPKTSTAKNDWAPVGSSAGLSQAASGASDVYGYDVAYSTGTGHSNGTAYHTTVTQNSNRSETATFNFTGTGFDLISSCDNTTGIMIVTVKQGSTIKKVYMVDTYYKDANIATSLKQVPIVSFTGAYGTYTVEATAAYLSSANAVKKASTYAIDADGTEIEASAAVVSNDEMIAAMLAEIGMEELAGEDIEVIWMDDNSIFNGGTGAERNDGSASMYAPTLNNYIDGVRVYNPVNGGSTAYVSNEQGATYYNVINELADVENGAFTNIKDIFAYVEGGTFSETGFANYQKNGPQNELYLSNNAKGVTFSVTLPNSSARVMLGVRAASGVPQLSINGVKAYPINTATELYYDITDCLTPVNGVAPVVITNTGTGLLAVNNLKLVGAVPAAANTTDLSSVRMMMARTPEVVEYSLPATDEVVGYPGSEPNRVVANPDPDLDPVGEYIITYPSVEPDDSYDDAKSAIASFFEKVVSFFKSIFALISENIKLWGAF